MKSRVRNTSVLVSLTVFVVVIWVMLASVPKTSAIPAFSRKYQTSCTTCHNNYPELNDFGEAFKKNGFKFPKDDESFVKEPIVMLGAKAQKEAFPGAVYPGEIPGSVPVAFRYSGNFSYNAKQPKSITPFLPRTDLFAPNTFTIIGAGSFGPNLSFWVDNDISNGGADGNAFLGDGYIKFNDLGHRLGLPKDTLNLRMGEFELDLPITQARTINVTPYDVYSQASIAGTPGTTNNPMVFGIPQRGFEFGGYPNDGNFSWSIAYVNGNNSGPAVRNSKDVYVRVSQRFNLERDPEVRKEVRAAGPTGPRDHTSLRFGAFYYYGRNELNTDGVAFPNAGVLREPFYRAGGDIRFKYRKLEVYGVGMYGRDQNLVLNGTGTGFQRTTPVTFSGGFAQANYWIYPWVIALMRYDFVNSPTDFSTQNVPTRYDTRNRFSPGVQFLIRANVKWNLEYQYRWQRPNPDTSTATNPTFYRANGLVTGFDYVF